MNNVRPFVPLPSPRVRALAPCPHGSVTDAELRALGLERPGVIDFSASTNPLGPSPHARQVLAELAIGRYPDDNAAALQTAIARHIGLDPAGVLVGNGSVELIFLLALAYLDPGDRVVVVGPTFGEYARAARMMGADVTEWRADAAAAFQPDVPTLCAAIRRLGPKLVFLCNPNNPTGVLLGRADITSILDATPGLLVLDEAYISFVESPPRTLDLRSDGRLVVLRSLTKDCALAGLRLGYAVAVPEVIEVLRSVRYPWSVNAAAQAAGLAALADVAHLQRSLAVVQEAKRYLQAELSNLGLRVLPAAANFMLVEVGDGQRFRRQVLQRGCCLRDCTSFGLPTFVRIGVRTLPECRQLVAAIAAVQAGPTLGGRP
jgi:histidinol-phosphate aminotransferase